MAVELLNTSTEICNPCPIVLNPIHQNFCDFTTWGGGIKALLFLVCGTDLGDMNDMSSGGLLAQAIAANKLVITPWTDTKGSYLDPTFTTVDTSSCCPPLEIMENQKLQFEDWNVDLKNFTHVDFYNMIYCYQKQLCAGWLTCDNYFYGWQCQCSWRYKRWENRPEKSKGQLVSMKSEITFCEEMILKPIHVPGITSMFPMAA